MRYKRKKQASNGEFVCSYFSWVTPENQKEIASRLAEITEKK